MYITVEQVAATLRSLGKGALLAKVDIESTYKHVSIHPDDRLLVAIRWKNGICVDTVLPFRLRSALVIFTAIADSLQWIVRQRGVELIKHYQDDFILMGGPHDQSCQRGLDTLISMCDSEAQTGGKGPYT